MTIHTIKPHTVSRARPDASGRTAAHWGQRALPPVVAAVVVALGVWLTGAAPAAYAQAPADSGTVLTIAGNGTQGYAGDNGPATNAALYYPSGSAIGPDGALYFVDNGNYRIRRVDPVTGVITTIAGNGNCVPDGYGPGDGGPATNASFCGVLSIAVDRARNVLYLADLDNNRVRQVNLTSGIVSHFAGQGLFGTGFAGDGGPAASAQFAGIQGLAVDYAGNVFIADFGNYRIRKVDIATGIITTVAGIGDLFSHPCAQSGDGGLATAASLIDPGAVAVDRAGNLFILDYAGACSSTNFPNLVRRVDAATGIITTVIGGGTNVLGPGPATGMNLTNSTDITVSADGTAVFVAAAAPGISAEGGVRIYKLDVPSGQLSIFAGTGISGFSGDGGPATNADFSTIYALTVTPAGELIASDSQSNARLRYIVPDSIKLTGDSQQTAYYLPWVSELVGDLTIAGNPALGTLDLGLVSTVGGSVSISSNTAASVIDLSSLASSGGAVSVNANTSASTIDLGSLATTGGSVSISSNTAASVIDLGSLTNVCGDLTITSNAPDAGVNLNSLTNFGCGTNPVTMTVDGNVSITNGLTLDTNATLSGSATVDGSVTNEGTISPGSSPGRLGITGRLVLGTTSKLRLEIGGYAPGTGFDVINVGASATLGGTLSITLLDPFLALMTNGAAFTVLTSSVPVAGALVNAASGATVTTTDGYARFTVRYAGQTTLRLTDLVLVDSDSDGLPDWWEDRYGLDKNNLADAALDTDGDGATNLGEFLAGTNPTNAASFFHILGVQPEGAGLRVSWSAVGGKSYALQTNVVSPSGGLGTNFADISPLIPVLGTGETATNYVDPAGATNASGAYYRVRLGP